MTMFSSRTAESFDPKPMVSLQTNVRHARDVWCDTSYCLHDPRPHFEPTRPARHPDDSEFERDMTDAEWAQAGLPMTTRPEPNPILVEYRLDQIQRDEYSAPGYWLTHIETIGSGLNATREQINHARRVLTWLATLEGDNK